MESCYKVGSQAGLVRAEVVRTELMRTEVVRMEGRLAGPLIDCMVG